MANQGYCIHAPRAQYFPKYRNDIPKPNCGCSLHLGVISLGYHLLHGFQSAFQSMGWNHKKWTPVVRTIGVWFSIIVPLVFALMPIAVHFGWIS